MFLLGAVRLKYGLAVNHFRPCRNSVAASLEKVCGRGAPTTHLLRLAAICKARANERRRRSSLFLSRVPPSLAADLIQRKARANERRRSSLLIPSAAEARDVINHSAKVRQT